MSFYRDQVDIVIPRKVDDYGKLRWSYNPPASVDTVPFLVEFQPVTTADSSIDTSSVVVETMYRLFTPPGMPFTPPAAHRIRYLGDDFDIVGDLVVWPSSHYPSGVDHVEASYQRIGVRNGGCDSLKRPRLDGLTWSRLRLAGGVATV